MWGIIAHATEGVWGFACDPHNKGAIDRILQIKGREAGKGMLLIAASATVFEPALGQLSKAVKSQVLESWPGHVTWLLPGEFYPETVRGKHATVACRVPDHIQARNIAAAFGGALLSTSLNLSGGRPILDYADAVENFKQHVDLVVPGQTAGYRGASAIRDLDGLIIREAVC